MSTSNVRDIGQSSLKVYTEQSPSLLTGDFVRKHKDGRVY